MSMNNTNKNEAQGQVPVPEQAQTPAGNADAAGQNTGKTEEKNLPVPANELYSREDLARLMGVTKEAIRQQMEEAGIKPVVEAVKGNRYKAGSPALYDRTVYEKFLEDKKNKKELVLQRKSEKAANLTLGDPAAVQIVFEKTVDNMTVEDKLLSAAYFITSLRNDVAKVKALEEENRYMKCRIAELEERAERLDIELEGVNVELGDARSWASVKRIEADPRWFGTKFKWKPLKQYCMDKGLEIRKTFDQNYGEVNAYPAGAWKEVYGVEF